MDSLVGLVVGFLIGTAIVAVLAMVAIRSSFGRLGVRSWREYLGLLVHELLPERRSDFTTLEPRVARRLTDERLALSSGTTLAMGHFVLTFAPGDLAELGKIPSNVLASNFEQYYIRHVKQQGWVLPKNQRISFTLRADNSFKRGSFSVIGSPIGHEDLSSTDASTAAPEAATIPSATKVMPSETLMTVPAGECHIVLRTDVASQSFSSAAGLVSVGRAKENSFRVSSPGVSRRHAVLKHTSHGWEISPSPEAVNGVFLGSNPIDSATVIESPSRFSFGKRAVVEIVPECSHMKFEEK